MASVAERSQPLAPEPGFRLNSKSSQDWRVRLLVALVIAVLSATYCAYMMHSVPGQPVASDFTYHWLAVRALMKGANPYQSVTAGGQFHLDGGYLYPLPATLIAFPFAAWLSPVASAAVFVGLSSGLFAWGATSRGYGRLAAVGGIPFFWSVSSGQLSVLLTASAMLPGLGWLIVAKPNLALGLFAYHPKRSTVIFGIAFVAFSLLIMPHWPIEWWRAVRVRTESNYTAPILLLGGFPLLAALLKWRRPEARLLIAMALMPQSHVFYDQLPLILVPKKRNESMLLVITGFIGYAAATWLMPPDASPSIAAKFYSPAIIFGMYLPCLVMVLRRPNIPEPREVPPPPESR
jgi:nitrogen fixation-related uncharacterized protein